LQEVKHLKAIENKKDIIYSISTMPEITFVNSCQINLTTETNKEINLKIDKKNGNDIISCCNVLFAINEMTDKYFIGSMQVVNFETFLTPDSLGNIHLRIVSISNNEWYNFINFNYEK